MNKFKRLIAILLIPIFLSVQGCALLAIPLALLSLPMMLIGGALSLVGPALSAATKLAPYALLFVKKDTDENKVTTVAKADTLMNKKIQDNIPVDKIIRARIETDPKVESVVFMFLTNQRDWKNLDESVAVLKSRGYKVDCVISRKGNNTVNLERLNDVSNMMERKKIKFFEARI